MTTPTNTRKRRTNSVDGSVSKSTRIKREGVVEQSTEPLHQPAQFTSEPAYVSVGQKVTIQPVQYEPIQCSIQITIPCEATPEAIDKAAAWASKKVDALLKEELTKATAGV